MSSLAPLPDPTRQLDVVVLTSPKNHWREPVLILGSQVWRLRNNSLLEGYVYEKILFEITAHIHTHFLLHAGVVEKDGQGIIIAGGSGHGKTTLVLALLQHGFKFLSDEMAAIGRSDRHIHPFLEASDSDQIRWDCWETTKPLEGFQCGWISCYAILSIFCLVALVSQPS
ncbi:hypothetical protein KFU94_11880 [Chloroflexi bacterium TSY]|nr:hypothetical protein [Chloroflexi bacterium TSY]